jgi:hypothetical protein
MLEKLQPRDTDTVAVLSYVSARGNPCSMSIPIYSCWILVIFNTAAIANVLSLNSFRYRIQARDPRVPERT